MERKSSWTEQDLTNLIGLPESSRREYKDSRLFEKNQDEVARDLSKEVSAPNQGHMAYIIDIPAGSTAYQAKDRLYYGRSEFEAKALPDHEIRLRMMRGRAAQARLEVIDCCCLTAEEEWIKRNADIKEHLDRLHARRAKELQAR